MKAVLELFEWIGSGVQMSLRTVRHLPSLPWQWKRLVEQCLFMGYATVPLVAILSTSIADAVKLFICSCLSTGNNQSNSTCARHRRGEIILLRLRDAHVRGPATPAIREASG